MTVLWRYTMYYISPVTYLVGGILSVVLNNVPVVCDPQEMVHFNPPASETCGRYASDFLRNASGYLVNPNATADCQYCQLSNANGVTISFSQIIKNVVPCNVEHLPWR